MSTGGTRREQIRQLLEADRYTLAGLARALGTAVSGLEDEIRHIERSARRRLTIDPAECQGCDFVFRDRSRLGAPSRCPRCRSERIDPPVFGF